MYIYEQNPRVVFTILSANADNNIMHHGEP